jgi:hypothetical protein
LFRFASMKVSVVSHSSWRIWVQMLNRTESIHLLERSFPLWTTTGQSRLTWANRF